MSRYIIFEATIFALSNIMFASTADGVSHQKEINRLFEEYRIKPNDKCGFHIIAQYYGTPGDRFNIKKILQSRPLNDTSVVSPHGKFRIHFDTTNVNGNQPFLYDSTGQEIPNSTYALVDSVAEICDYVYHVEVDSFGYPPPPSDSGAGGGDEYDIYIQSLPTGIYGYPDWDPSKPLISRTNPTYAAWTVIRNEFQSTYTKGIPAIEVTIAHEFHHAIQVGNYGFWQNDLWFYELTSTWMEQVVYPEVKDYYQYLSNFFDNVDLPFNLYQPDDFEGYERCVFGIFLQNEPGYGAGLMKSIWESMVREPPIPAMEDAFVSDGKDPSSVFQLFAQLNYFTNYRTQLASKFNIVPYPLGNDYPLVKISGSEGISQSNSSADFSDMAMRLTEHFYQVSYQIFYQTKIDTDTVGIAVVNTNFSAAVNYDTTNYPFSVGISAGGSGCVRELTNGYCIFFETSDHTDWGIVPFITGNDTSLTFTMKDNIPFPQPFNPSSHTLKIPYSFPGASDITLAVFSTSGILLRKISSAGGTISLLGESYFEWDGRDETGKIVSSGIYIYVLTDGSKSVVGKIAVVRN